MSFCHIGKMGKGANMKYRALTAFINADNGVEYAAGDTVDVSGMSRERIKELMGSNNRAGVPLIDAVKEEVKEKTTHGKDN